MLAYLKWRKNEEELIAGSGESQTCGEETKPLPALATRLFRGVAQATVNPFESTLIKVHENQRALNVFRINTYKITGGEVEPSIRSRMQAVRVFRKTPV